MSTLNDPEIIVHMLRHDGHGQYAEDPPADHVYLYANMFNGGPAYKIIWAGYEDNFVEVGAYRGVPVKLLHERQPTEAGEQWLKENCSET